MQDVDAEGRVAGAQQQQQQQQAAGLMDTLLSLIPGRKAQVSSEPSDDSIKRTHDYLRSASCRNVQQRKALSRQLCIAFLPVLQAFHGHSSCFLKSVWGFLVCLDLLPCFLAIVSRLVFRS